MLESLQELEDSVAEAAASDGKKKRKKNKKRNKKKQKTGASDQELEEEQECEPSDAQLLIEDRIVEDFRLRLQAQSRILTPQQLKQVTEMPPR